MSGPTYYNYFRDYDPASGRYVQSDLIGLNGGINTFGYVEANPMKYVDPDGLQFAIPGGGVAPPGAGGASPGLMNPARPIDPTDPTAGTYVPHQPLLPDWLTQSLESANAALDVAADIICPGLFAKSGRWSCTASCNVTVIDPKLDGKVPPRVTGSATGKTEPDACAEAKRAATQSAPAGTYARHCQCKCSSS